MSAGANATYVFTAPSRWRRAVIGKHRHAPEFDMLTEPEWMTGDLRLRVETDRSGIDALAESWNRLAERHAFHRWEWHRAWLGSFESETRPRILVVRDGRDNVVGIAPFCQTRRAAMGNVLQFTAAGDVCTDLMSIVCRQDLVEPVAELMVSAVTSPAFQSRYGRIDLVELEGFASGERSVEQMIERLATANWRMERRTLENTWRVDLAGGWEGLRSGVRKSIRRKINRAQKRFKDPEFRFEMRSDWSDIEPVWPEFVTLHQKRRNELGQPGCFADHRFENFLLEATRALADHGLAKMSVVWFQDRMLSTVLCFELGEGLGMYQSGTETELSHLEPGHLANAWTLRYAIDHGYRWFDYLRGDEPYKAQWGAVPTAVQRVRLWSPKLSTRLRRLAFSAGRSVVQWGKRQRILGTPGEVPSC